MFAHTDKIFFPAICISQHELAANLTLYFHKFNYFSIFIHLLKEHYLGEPNDILIIILLWQFMKKFEHN